MCVCVSDSVSKHSGKQARSDVQEVILNQNCAFLDPNVTRDAGLGFYFHRQIQDDRMISYQSAEVLTFHFRYAVGLLIGVCSRNPVETCSVYSFAKTPSFFLPPALFVF